MKCHCEVCLRETTWTFALRNSRDFLLRWIRQKQVSFWVCDNCGLVKQIPKVPSSVGKKVYQLKEFRPFSAAEYVETSQLSKSASGQYKWIEQELEGRCKFGRVLDVGCAAGSLLNEFKSGQWETYGIEPTAGFASHARSLGHQIQVGYLDESTFPGVQFDLITASHVLEHIHDPETFLTNVRSRLKEDGYLFVEVPDILRPYGHIWFLFFSVNHVYHFNSFTLQGLLRNAGFFLVGSELADKGVRVLCHSARDRQGTKTVLVQPGQVLQSIRSYQRRNFHRQYLRQHLLWDLKLGLLRLSQSILGAERGERLYDGFRGRVRRAFGRQE